MATRFLLTLLLVGLGEIYTFILIRSMVRNLPKGWKFGVFFVYILFTLLTWASIFFFRRIDWASLPHMTRNIFVAFTIGWFVGKILIGAVMLIDDLRRIILFLLLKFFPD